MYSIEHLLLNAKVLLISVVAQSAQEMQKHQYPTAVLWDSARTVADFCHPTCVSEVIGFMYTYINQKAYSVAVSITVASIL